MKTEDDLIKALRKPSFEEMKVIVNKQSRMYITGILAEHGWGFTEYLDAHERHERRRFNKSLI